jgi:hypothetical protein
MCVGGGGKGTELGAGRSASAAALLAAWHQRWGRRCGSGRWAGCRSVRRSHPKHRYTRAEACVLSPLPPSPPVITGIQIHNWAPDFEDDSPNLEFLAPTAVYVVVGGRKTHLDLSAMPVSWLCHASWRVGCACRVRALAAALAGRCRMGPAYIRLPAAQSRLLTGPTAASAPAAAPQPVTPRQMRAIAGPADVCNQGGQTMLREEASPYAFDSKHTRRRRRERLLRWVPRARQAGGQPVFPRI